MFLWDLQRARQAATAATAATAGKSLNMRPLTKKARLLRCTELPQDGKPLISNSIEVLIGWTWT